jgi:hypothetical protein
MRSGFMPIRLSAGKQRHNTTHDSEGPLGGVWENISRCLFNVGIRGMMYACIVIVSVSIGNYVGNFQVPVVLISRPSSGFPLLYFQTPTNNTAVVISQQTIPAQ